MAIVRDIKHEYFIAKEKRPFPYNLYKGDMAAYPEHKFTIKGAEVIYHYEFVSSFSTLRGAKRAMRRLMEHKDTVVAWSGDEG